jgi:hypothetical protein
MAQARVARGEHHGAHRTAGGDVVEQIGRHREDVVVLVPDERQHARAVREQRLRGGSRRFALGWSWSGLGSTRCERQRCTKSRKTLPRSHRRSPRVPQAGAL